MYRLRFESFDEKIYSEVYVNNEYRIKNDISDYVVIDVGCHIGSFIKLAIENNAKFVDAYELFPDNYKQCKLNMENYDNVKVSNKAVWRSDIDIESISISNSKLYSLINERHILNTGGESLLPLMSSKSIINIDTIKFDDILEENYNKFGKIDLVKIDCEGSEYPILYTSKKLGLVNNMVLECHFYNFEIRKESIVNSLDKYNEKDLSNYLREQGFIVYTDESKYISDDIYICKIFAMKDDNNNPFLIDYLKNGKEYLVFNNNEQRSNNNGFN